MSDWKLFLECSNGHRFGVEVVCPSCDEVVAEHLHTEGPAPGQVVIQPAPRKPTRRERRAMRREIERLERGDS